MDKEKEHLKSQEEKSRDGGAGGNSFKNTALGPMWLREEGV